VNVCVLRTVADKDTAFDNPAFIVDTQNQISIANDNVGYVFNAFGQKLAVHGGNVVSFTPNDSSAVATYFATNPMGVGNFNILTDQLDIFWGADLGFGALGVRASYGLFNDSTLFATNYTGNAFSGANTYADLDDDGNTADDNGTDSYSLDVNSNSVEQKSSAAEIEVGAKLNDLPVDGSLQITLPSFSSASQFDVVDVENIAGVTTATDRNTHTFTRSQTAESTGGLSADLMGRYLLNESTFITGGFSTESGTIENNYTEVDDRLSVTLAGPTTTVDTTDTDKTRETYESSDMTVNVGVDYRKNVGPAMFKVQSSLVYTSSSVTKTNETLTDTFVDVITPASNTTGATGVTTKNLVETTSINAPLRISAEFTASEKWTWRAGTSSNLLEKTDSKTTTTNNKVDQAATGFELDFVAIDAETGSLEFLDFFNEVSLGFTYSPAENVALDAALDTTGNLSTWGADFALTINF